MSDKKVTGLILVCSDGTSYSTQQRTGCDDCVEIDENLFQVTLEKTKLFTYADISKRHDPDYAALAGESL